MQSAICLLSVVPMRKEAAHRSEMVSQVLFGEYVSIIEEKDDFVFIRCLYDGYEGWVQANQLQRIEEREIFQTATFTNAFSSLVAKDKSSLQIPYASPVYNAGQLSFTVAGSTFNYLFQPQQVWNSRDLSFNEKTLQAVYQPFLNTPYLWGGKSVFGIDCSGFAQQVFKFFSVRLLRDAYLQAEQGTPVSSLEESKPGDLAFFQNEKGRVTHVGIILGDNQIVHASGKVRIDPIDSNGITNAETGRQTHTMHSIRRFF
jgi:gamma-D-glutamyl-L-lysine dipeptidyl-peptidase